MKNTIILSLLAFILVACSQDVHEVKKSKDHARESNESQLK